MRRRIEKDRSRELDQGDMLRMNVGELHWEAQFDLISDKLPHKRFVRKFLESIADHIFEGRGLLLWGGYGTGKTAIGAIICKEVVKRLGTAYLVSAMDLADAVIGKEWFDKDETVAQRLLSVNLLVIDELGGGQSDRTGWNKAYVERIVRTRTRVRQSTICISNLDLADLKAHYGGGLMAIMGEKIYPVEVKGKNWRDDKRNDLKRFFED